MKIIILSLCLFLILSISTIAISGDCYPVPSERLPAIIRAIIGDFTIYICEPKALDRPQSTGSYSGSTGENMGCSYECRKLGGIQCSADGTKVQKCVAGTHCYELRTIATCTGESHCEVHNGEGHCYYGAPGDSSGGDTGGNTGGGGPGEITNTCYDGIKNGDETGIDCGGSCRACLGTGGTAGTCNDGIKNGYETGVDCGGNCPRCPECTRDGDCGGDDTCENGVCVPYTGCNYECYKLGGIQCSADGTKVQKCVAGKHCYELYTVATCSSGSHCGIDSSGQGHCYYGAPTGTCDQGLCAGKAINSTFCQSRSRTDGSTETWMVTCTDNDGCVQESKSCYFRTGYNNPATSGQCGGSAGNAECVMP